MARGRPTRDTTRDERADDSDLDAIERATAGRAPAEVRVEPRESDVARIDGREAPHERRYDQRLDVEADAPTGRAGGPGHSTELDDVDLTGGIGDGTHPGDAQFGDDPFGLDTEGLIAEGRGDLPDVPGAGDALSDPFGMDLEGVPDDHSLAGNETGDATNWVDLGATIGGVALGSNPVAQAGFGAYGITRAADEALGVSDAAWEAADAPVTGEFGDGEPVDEEPGDDSGVDPDSSQLGDDKPDDHGDTQDPNGQSKGQPDTEPEQSTEPEGSDGTEPEGSGDDGMSVGQPTAPEGEAAPEADPSTDPDTVAGDYAPEAGGGPTRTPSMDPEIGETYFEIQQAARGGAEVQFADDPKSGDDETVDYDGVDYGEGGLAPVQDVPADAIEPHDAGVIDPHDDPVNSFVGVDDSADAAMEGAEPSGDAAEVMDG